MALNAGKHIGIAQEHHEEHDHETYRKRVQMWAEGDGLAYASNPVGFSSGDSPLILDTYTDLGRTGHGGFIVNDGPGDLKIEASADGNNYGGQFSLRDGDVLNLDNTSFRRIRLTYVDDTEFRVMIT